MERQVLLFLSVFLLVGCESKDPEKKFSELWNQTVDVSNTALDQVSKLDPDEAKREFRKLTQFEYQVRSVRPDISAAELQALLAELGKESWDCASPIQRTADFLLVCKRRPESILRYVPQTLLGKP